MTELEEFRAEVAAWLKANKPAEPDFLLPESFMEVGSDEQFHYLRDWQRKVYDAGFLGLAWPKAYGGGGRPQVFQDIVNHEMADLRLPFMLNILGLNTVGPLLLTRGTEEEKQRYIPGILNAEDIWCQGFSEPDCGSDLVSMQTRAVHEGETYRINGSKIWTSLGGYAKYMLLLARTSTHAEKKHAGISCFLIPMDAPGIDIVPIQKLTGEFGFVQTFLDDTCVDAACLLGQEGEGWRIAMEILNFERGAKEGQGGGLMFMEKRVSDVIELARNTLRNGKPAIEDPLVRDQLIKFLIEEQGDRLCLGRKSTDILRSEYSQAIALSQKLRGSEFRRRLCQFSISLQGINGVRWVGDPNVCAQGLWQRSYFNAFSSTIGGGPSEVQKNIVAERVLGLPKD